MTDRLHDDILNALPFDFVRRMRNWSRTMDGTSVSTSTLDERVDHTRAEHPIPFLRGEADDMHKLVQRLPARVQECIVVFWTHQARSVDWMLMSTLRLRKWALGPARFREHLDTGHRWLISALSKNAGAADRRDFV